jgi:hypothetical protein
MKNSQKKFVIPLIIALVVVVFIGGGVFIYSQKKIVNNNLLNSTTTTQNISTTTDETVDWKTYTDFPTPATKVTIKYPSNWNLMDFNFPCDNHELRFSIMGPTRYNLSGYENLPVAYFLQLCGSSEFELSYQGFVKLPITQYTTDKDKILLDDSFLKITDEFNDAQKIMSSILYTSEANIPPGQE